MNDYSEYDLHLNLVDAMDIEENVIEGVAIRSSDLTSFLIEYRQLCKKYGVSYDELLENDWLEDSSAAAAAKLQMAAERGVKVEDTVEIEPTAFSSGKGL